MFKTILNTILLWLFGDGDIMTEDDDEFFDEEDEEWGI